MKKTAFSILLVLISGCASLSARTDTAHEIANPAGFKETEIQAGFKLKAFERIQNKHEANIYIEGDGRAWLSRSRKSLNPTPTDPIALRLAAGDYSTNVVYLARPCQYVQDKKCDSDYWGQKRFAPEVIEAYMQALDSYGFEKINLIGYSGGAAIAAILAAKRDDVVSLRTVAGNVDTSAFSELHNISKLSGSINPADYAQQLSSMPQIHFIGGDDRVVTPILFRNYENNCLKLQTIENVSHEDGWAEAWPILLKQKPICLD